MKHDSPHRWHIPMLAWGGAFVVVGCSALLGLLAWNTTEAYQRQSRWERKEALTLQAQAITKQLLHEINTSTSSLQTLSASISPSIQGKRLQRALRRFPWLWHTVVLNRRLKLLYPSMPWETSFDASLVNVAHTASCASFKKHLHKSRAGQAARLFAGFTLVKRLPHCSLHTALRVPLLHDSHLRHASKRTWLYTSSQGQAVWQLRSPDYVMSLRMRDGFWIGFALPLQTKLSVLSKESPFRACWLHRLIPGERRAAHTMTLPLSGQLAGYGLSFQYRPSREGGMWLIGGIIVGGMLCMWLAIVALLYFLHRRGRLAEQRSALFSAIAHELKTPVAAQLSLIGNLQRLGTPSTRPYQEALFKESKRLQQLVDNLLALNRLELPSVEQRVDVTTLTCELLESFEYIAEERQQFLHFEGRTPQWAFMDRVGLELALRNLIDNALKYSPEGAEIRLDLYQEGGVLCWSIEDGGDGIPEALIPSLFMPFVRGESREQPGSGLGLYIAHNIIRQGRGELSLDREYTKGARFVIALPSANNRKKT